MLITKSKRKFVNKNYTKNITEKKELKKIKKFNLKHKI